MNKPAKSGIAIANPFKGAVKGRDFVGVDLSGDMLKAAHVRFSGGRSEVAGLVSKKIVGLSDTDIAKVVAAAMQELSAVDPVIIDIIPANVVITKNIEIPSIDPKEIAEIINLQAGRHTPYSREEILVDRVDIGVSKHNYTLILLVIVARHIVKRQFEIFEMAQLKTEEVRFAPEGIALASGRVFRAGTEDSVFSIVHIDEAATDFTVIHRDKIIFVRSIPIGAQLLAIEKDKYEIRFVEEIKRSLEAYTSENVGSNPVTFILTGALEETSALATFLGDSLQLPVRMVPYLKNLSLSGEALWAASAATRLSFLPVIAPLLAREELRVNLTPEEITVRKALERRGRDLLRTGILGLTILMLICLILMTKIYFKTTYVNELDKRYRTITQEAQKLEKSFTRVSLVKKYLSTRGYPVKVLAELYDIMPPDMEASDIRFDDLNKFTVRGTAESMSVVFAFMSAMEKSKYFKDVKAAYTTKRREGSKDLADFEITALFKKGSDQ